MVTELLVPKKCASLINIKRLPSKARITVASFIVMVLLSCVLLSGLVPDSRITALSGLISTLFVALAGIIGAYYGMQAWMSRK